MDVFIHERVCMKSVESGPSHIGLYFTQLEHHIIIYDGPDVTFSFIYSLVYEEFDGSVALFFTHMNTPFSAVFVNERMCCSFNRAI